MSAQTITAATRERVAALIAERRQGWSLPQAFYVDPAIYEFDLAAIHARSWILVGFEVELPSAGSRLASTVGKTPVVVVRGQDGVLRGFHNICRHRGAQLCADGTGTARRLICPYHQWSYGLDGQLLNAGRMPADFVPADNALLPIAVETAAGGVYVCLSDTPPDFAPLRDGLTPLLAPHRLDRAKLAFQSTLVEKANWKLVMENARECYHCSARHPELSVTFPTTSRRHFDADGNDRSIPFNARMTALGLPVGPAEGEWWQAVRFPLNEGTKSLTMDGDVAVKRLMCETGEGDIGSVRWAIEPHSFAHATADQVFMFSAMPTGPEETVVTSKWLVREDAEPGVDYDLDRLTALWTETNLQDRDLVENNHRGVRSLGYRPGRYSDEAEALTQRFVDWYCGRVRSYLSTNA